MCAVRMVLRLAPGNPGIRKHMCLRVPRCDCWHRSPRDRAFLSLSLSLHRRDHHRLPQTPFPHGSARAALVGLGWAMHRYASKGAESIHPFQRTPAPPREYLCTQSAGQSPRERLPPTQSQRAHHHHHIHHHPALLTRSAWSTHIPTGYYCSTAGPAWRHTSVCMYMASELSVTQTSR